ncbi:MAG: hypothetical protein FWC34_00380 [Bacteroidetes bacterium]|nr:hypothetical protein [Bacteroidota bacterium]
MHTFTASRWLDIAFPDRLEINANNVVYYKNNVGVGYESTVVERPNITKVHIRTGVFFANVVIESYGERLVVGAFWKRDAKAIVKLLT